MRVLLTNDGSKPEGGAESHVLLLKKLLCSEGLQVNILAAGSDADYEVRTLESQGIAETLVHSVNPSAKIQLEKCIREFKPDIIHFHNIHGQITPSVMQTIPQEIGVVMTLHDYFLGCPRLNLLLPDYRICSGPFGPKCLAQGCSSNTKDWSIDLVKRYRNSQFLSRVDCFIAPSRYMARTMKRWRGLDCIVAHNPVSIPEDGLQPSRGDGRILFVGRLLVEKGLLNLVEAMHKPKLEDAKLVIVGDGPLRQELQAAVNNMGLATRVKLAGWVTAEQLRNYRDACDVSVLASIWPENCSISIIEAMASQRPVVATSVGGNPELIPPGTGILVPKNNPVLLAEALSEVLYHSDLEEMGRAAYARAVEKHAPKVYLSKLLKVYELAIRKQHI